MPALAHRMDHGPTLAERVERSLVLLAYFIELDGDVHLPMYEKFEADLQALKTHVATRERARQRLNAYASMTGRRPIC